MRSGAPCWDFVWFEHVYRSYACCRRLCEFLHTSAPCLDYKTLCPWSHPPPLAPIIILGPLLHRHWAQEEGRGQCSIFRAEHSEVTSWGSWYLSTWYLSCYLLQEAASLTGVEWFTNLWVERYITLGLIVLLCTLSRIIVVGFLLAAEKLRICVRSFSDCCDETLTEAP